jgi:hypothetical protein
MTALVLSLAILFGAWKPTPIPPQVCKLSVTSVSSLRGCGVEVAR